MRSTAISSPSFLYTPTLPAHKAPQQQWFRLALDDRIEIVHSAGGDGDTARTASAVQGYILAPAVEVHPPRLMNHQRSTIGRLIVYIHALQAKSTLVASAMFLCDEKAPKCRTLAPGSIAEAGTLVGASATRTMHRIGAGRNFPLPTIPHIEARRAGGQRIVNKQRIVLVHVMATGERQSLVCPLLNGFILPSVGQLRLPVVFPCPMQTECSHSEHHQHRSPKDAPFLLVFHHFSLFEAAVSTTMDTHRKIRFIVFIPFLFKRLFPRASALYTPAGLYPRHQSPYSQLCCFTRCEAALPARRALHATPVALLAALLLYTRFSALPARRALLAAKLLSPFETKKKILPRCMNGQDCCMNCKSSW